MGINDLVQPSFQVGMQVNARLVQDDAFRILETKEMEQQLKKYLKPVSSPRELPGPSTLVIEDVYFGRLF